MNLRKYCLYFLSQMKISCIHKCNFISYIHNKMRAKTLWHLLFIACFHFFLYFSFPRINFPLRLLITSWRHRRQSPALHKGIEENLTGALIFLEQSFLFFFSHISRSQRWNCAEHALDSLLKDITYAFLYLVRSFGLNYTHSQEMKKFSIFIYKKITFS